MDFLNPNSQGLTLSEMDDDAAIARAINNPDALGDILAPGGLGHQEHAEDAIDYEDISDDDDLPDEEPAGQSSRGPLARSGTIETEDYSDDDGDLMDLAAEGMAGVREGGSDDEDDGGLASFVSEAVGGKQARSPHPESDIKMMDVDDDLFGEGSLDDLFGNNAVDDVTGLSFPVPQLPGGLAPSTAIDEKNNRMLTDAVHSMFRDVDFSGQGMETRAPIPVPEAIRIQKPSEEIHELFPHFKKGAILPFLKMFPPKPVYYPMRPEKPQKALFPTKLHLEIEPSTEVSWRAEYTAPVRKPGIIYIDPDEDLEVGTVVNTEENEAIRQHEAKTDREIEVATTSWSIKGLDEPETGPTPRRRKAPFDDDENEAPDKKRMRLALQPSFIDIAGDVPDFAEPLEYDPEAKPKPVLDMNDPYLLVDVRKPDEMRRQRRIGGEFIRQKIKKDLTQRYNISNDEAYDLLKENHQSKVRSTIGQLEIEHTLPAVRLQTPYYKTQLSKPEMRSFHRPRLTFPIDAEIRFSKGKTLKRKHFKGKTIKEIFHDTKSLSLSDNSNFILMEYSEEHPYVLSNFGMGSRVINYYRRKEDRDETRPKCELGELQVLMSQDKSPFWNFGSIMPGEIVPALYNRMVRAPIFKHNPKSTDFLVVRNTDSGGAYYYLRTIPHLFTVGQSFPVTDVPGPHSRKVTTASKNRMKMITYRVIRKKGNKISVKDISKHFPENTEIQTRQKMKEFMSHQTEKDSERGGYWYLKGDDPIPEESQIRSMVIPESVCLLDSMQVGGLYLEDAGYGRAADAGDEDEKEGMSTEEKLAPWIATKNFINATQGKAMLQLHGEGDPTGRGEAFSFIKTSMKGGFKAIGESVDERMDAATIKALGGHSYNVARQQKAYEETIEKIWRAQEASLKNEEPIELDPDEMQDASHEEGGYDDGRTPYSEGMTPAMTPATTTLMGTSASQIDDDGASQFSRLSARNSGNKVLRITRSVVLSDGTTEKKIEVINDPKVIRMYIHRRQEMDLENLKRDISLLKPTGDPVADAQTMSVLQGELNRLYKNKERRQARERQNEKKRKELGLNLDDSPAGKTGTTRKCANCGQVGHIKTNKKMCPLLNGTIKKAGEGGSEAGGSAPAAAAGPSN